MARPTRISCLRTATGGEAFADEALASQLGSTPEAVRELSCGRIRTSAPDGIGPAGLSLEPARAVLGERGIGTEALDFIVFGTTTPDVTFPGSACFLQAMLEAPTIGCLDVRSQCTSFLTSIDTASRFVASGAYDTVLVAEGDVPTHVLRYDGVEPELACLMGDAAAVVLIEPAADGERGRLLSVATRIDGRRYREFWCQSPESRARIAEGAARFGRITKEALETGAIYPRFDATAMRETALTNGPEIFLESLERAGLSQVDATVVAHLLPDVAVDLAARLGSAAGRIIFPEKAYSFGSTLPVALAGAAESGAIAEGETVALVTAGAGASWGSAIIRW